MIDREELRRLCEAATPGPWRACKDGACDCRMIWSRAVDCVVAVGIAARDEQYTSGEGIVDDKALMSNAAFIAAARTAVPALLDALDEAEAMVSALNGDVTELGQRLEAAEERERGLRKALEEIARQKLHAEITDRDPDELDWLGGYEVCVKRARSAIAETAP